MAQTLTRRVIRECKELVDALISFGAEIDDLGERSEEGRTAIELSAERGRTLDSNKTGRKTPRT